MSVGNYFAIGDIKGGKKFKDILRYLADSNNLQCPHVLYIGAAAANNLRYKSCFERGFMALFPKGHVSSLNLSAQTAPYSGDGDPTKIARRFGEADIIYFEGGDITPLRGVFAKFNLKQFCQQAFKKGALVGGLCGGGSILADQVVHYNSSSAQIVREKGIGLLPNLTVSCHIDIEDQRQQRIRELMNASAQNSKSIALGTNQAVIFNAGNEQAIYETVGSTASPFYVDKYGATIPLNVVSI